ncbi:MAG TPA: hypothetical protein VFQ24_16685 [Terriglobia bacterium]|nr:hypothetical protein [Terriglobia bacterium]
MPSPTLYDDLKNALNQFKTFLDANVATIKPAIQALKQIPQVGPQIGQLVTKLIGLLTSLKTQIQNLNVGGIQGLAQVAGFSGAAKTLLQTAETLLPDQKAAIDDVLNVVNVVTGLPSLDAVKKDITDLIDAIVGDLNALNA